MEYDDDECELAYVLHASDDEADEVNCEDDATPSQSIRLDPDVQWDPEDIDVEFRPPPPPPTALQHLTSNNDAQFLEYTARNNKCSAGLGETFVKMSFPEEMDNLQPGERPLFYTVCVTVLPHEMTGGFRFGDLRHLDQAGRAKATIMALFISSFCNPAHGSYFDYDDPLSPPLESYFFDVPKINRRFYKVYVVTEALFKKTYGVDSNGERYELKTHELFNSKNISGYRMWFLISDPNLHPTDAIIKQINANIKQMGLGSRARTVSPYAPALLSYAQDVAMAAAPPDADVEQVARAAQRISVKHAAKINTAVARQNKEMRMARREFRKELQTGNSSDIRNAALEITSLVDFYNKLICYEERCLEPNCANIQCQRCCDKMTPAQEFFTDPQLSIDPERRRDTWLAALDVISYRPISASSEIGATLNSCLQMTGERSNVLQLIDPCYHFTLFNSTTQKLCGMPGISVCADQMDNNNYTSIDVRGRHVFRVPLDQAIFVYAPDAVAHPNFFDMRMPWCIDLRDFEISAIECYAQSQKHRAEKEYSRRFFSSINPTGIVTRTAAIVSEHWRRHIPESIPASLAGGEYDTSQDKISVSILPSKQQQEDNDNRVVHIKDVFYKEGEIFRTYVSRLRKCIYLLTPDEIQHVVGVIREEGRRVFQSVFRTTEQNTRVAKAAIQRLADLSRNDKSAFHEIPVISSNMHSTFGNYILQQYAMAEAAGLMYTHTLFLRLRWAIMRAAHCHLTDAFFKKVTLLLNECFFGVPGAGKTFAAKVAGDYSLPHSIQTISSSSDASFVNMESQGDTMKMFDEMRPAVCPGMPGAPRDEAYLQMLKEQMTSHGSSRTVTQLNTSDSGVTDIMKRQVLTIKSVDHSAVCLFGNNAPTYKREASYWTRFTVHLITKHVERFGNNDIASQAVNSSGGSINDSTSSLHSNRQEWAKTEHALNVAICRQICVGALPYPNLDVLDYMWQPAYKRLREIFPSVSAMTRAAERIVSLTLTFVITNAIYLVFNSLWSPLIHFNLDKQELKYDAYNHDQLRAIAPLLRADEDMSIYAITTALLLDFCPPDHHVIAKSLAETFGLLNTPTPEYATHRYMNQEFKNTNYVSCGLGAQVIKHLEDKFGHNRFTAFHVIGLLEETTIMADFYNPAMPTAPPSRRPIHVLTKTKTQDHTSPSPEVEFLTSNVHIAVEFVKKWSPDVVLREIMQAMCHNKIKERQIVIGPCIEGFPFLPNVWTVKPGPKPVDLSLFKQGKSYIRDALIGECALTREANEQRKLFDSDHALPSDGSSDPETYLTVRWLRENVELPPGIEPEYYTRAEIENTARRRKLEWFPNHVGKNYPHEIVEEYRKKYEQSSMPVLEEEEGNFVQADFDRVIQKSKERHAAATSSSSSSSSSSRGSKVADLSEFISAFNPSKRPTPSSSSSSSSSTQKRPCVRPSE